MQPLRKLTVALLIFLTGGGLGWYAHNHWGADKGQSAPLDFPAASQSINPNKIPVDSIPMALDHVSDMKSLLQRNDFDPLMERYEVLQRQASDTTVANARAQILAHARQLMDAHAFSLAEQLLQRFLVAAYRDVEARILLAAAYEGQQDFHAAIDQLFEAKGYAYRPAILQRITTRIRSMVAGLTQSLTRNDDQNGLLVLYQRLIQLEPDHAPYFMGLAAAQLALDDREAALRSLLLVSQDPDVGAQAQAMLSELSIASAGTQEAETWEPAMAIGGIPLHRDGSHFIVDARPARGRSIRLLIDTGASLTIFTPEVLEQRGVRYQDSGRTGIFNTANGSVTAPIVRLDSLEVGDWQVNQLEIGVLDLGSRLGVDGLLGMNFLNQFRFFIDQNEPSLRLTVN